MAGFLDAGQIMAGDIIVDSSKSAAAQGINLATASDIAHAALCTGPGMLIESISPVTEQSFEKAFKGVDLIIALRYRGITQQQRLDVVANARKFENHPYDLTGAIGSGTLVRRGKAIAVAGCLILPVACAPAVAAVQLNATEGVRDTAFFCSELVARAFELSGIPLSDTQASFINPRMIRMCSKLTLLGKVDASKYQ